MSGIEPDISEPAEVASRQPEQAFASPYVADPANPTDAELSAAIERGLANGTLIDADDWLAQHQAEAAESQEAAWERVGQARAELDKALEAGGEEADREAEAAFGHYLDAWHAAVPEDAEASAQAERDAIIDQIRAETEAQI